MIKFFLQLSFLGLLVAGAYFFVKSPLYDPHILYDAIERLAFESSQKFGRSNRLEFKLDEVLGSCSAMSVYKKVGSPDKSVWLVQNPKPLPEQRVAFAERFAFEEFSVICQTPQNPKSFMITPAPKAELTLRREFGQVPSAFIEHGSVRISSDHLNLLLRLKSFDLSLSSKGPVAITLYAEPHQIVPVLSVVSGSLELQHKTRGSGSLVEPVKFDVGPKGKLIYDEGKELENASALLLPSGIQLMNQNPPRSPNQ